MYVKDCGALPRTPKGTVFAPLRSVLNECPLGIQHPLTPSFSRTFVRLEWQFKNIHSHE